MLRYHTRAPRSGPHGRLYQRLHHVQERAEGRSLSHLYPEALLAQLHELDGRLAPSPEEYAATLAEREAVRAEYVAAYKRRRQMSTSSSKPMSKRPKTVSQAIRSRGATEGSYSTDDTSSEGSLSYGQAVERTSSSNADDLADAQAQRKDETAQQTGTWLVRSPPAPPSHLAAPPVRATALSPLGSAQVAPPHRRREGEERGPLYIWVALLPPRARYAIKGRPRPPAVSRKLSPHPTALTASRPAPLVVKPESLEAKQAAMTIAQEAVEELNALVNGQLTGKETSSRYLLGQGAHAGQKRTSNSFAVLYRPLSG